MRFRKLGTLIVYFLLINLLISCYEGSGRFGRNSEFKNNPNGSENGGNSGNNRTAGTKPYYFILFEPISLSAESLKTPNCFAGPESERTYRINEWTQRINLIRKGLEELADSVTTYPTNIKPEDCKNLNAIEVRASFGFTNKNENPLPKSIDPKNRISLHIKAVFWDRDVYEASPSKKVYSRDWQDVLNLNAAHIRTRSLQYMLISNKTWGYFESWRMHLNFDNSENSHLLSIDGIHYPDPGANGITYRQQRIAQDTIDFFEWLKGVSLESSSENP